MDTGIKYIEEFQGLLKKKRILMRVDFNVPLDEYRNIVDDVRIRSVLPTINFCLDEGASVILMSHMGRPKGKVDPSLSLLPVVKRLERYLNKKVEFIPYEVIGEEVKKRASSMEPGEVMLLDNLRFHPGEEKNDESFARELASLGEIYVNDAFSVSHRAHASVVGVTKFVKECCAGFLMKKELNYFKQALENPQRPFAALLGGAKVAGKIEAIKNLLKKVDKLLIGGGMAFTFLKAWGYSVGASLVEEGYTDIALEIIENSKRNGIKLYLPVDCVITNKFDFQAKKLPKDAEVKIVPIKEIPDGWFALDIGPATIMLFKEALSDAKTIIWNGPMGVFEAEPFSRGTYAMVTALSSSYALTIVGGGDTDVAIHKAGATANISYISTGGGAFIELLEGKVLPGIKALQEFKRD
jgi:phosphoglycerate kinase